MSDMGGTLWGPISFFAGASIPIAPPRYSPSYRRKHIGNMGAPHTELSLEPTTPDISGFATQ